MTEFGANLSSIVSSTDGKLPSIFEVLAQENLFSTLQPALKHILRVAAERNPHIYGRLYVYCDELYALLQLLLESYYIKTYNASFSENFYGLRRTSSVIQSAVDNVSSSNSLTRTERLHSLLCLIALPYAKTKCDKWYESLTADGWQNRLGLHGSLCKLFTDVYPLLHSLYEIAVLYFQLTYTFGLGNCHSPLLYLARLTLRHLTNDEINTRHDVYVSLSSLMRHKSCSQRTLILLNRTLTLASVFLSTGLSVGVFFLQFVDWWYTTDQQRAMNVMSVANPGPPKKDSKYGHRHLSGICPLCNKLCINSTVLSVSGSVFIACLPTV
jgi:peroxin-12